MLEGELIFQVEDALVTKRAGELAFAPRGVAHTLANHSDAPARYLLVCTPAGFERYFARMNEDPPRVGAAGRSRSRSSGSARRSGSHDRGMRLPVMPPVAPMLAKVGADLPPGAFYEPKWDGFRCIVFRDGDEVELGSRNTQAADPLLPRGGRGGAARACRSAAWSTARSSSPAADGRLDFEALQQRIHPAASRGRPAGRSRRRRSFVAFDLLALGDEDLTGRGRSPSAGRALEAALADARPPVHLTPHRPRDAGARARVVRAVRGRRARRGHRQAARPDVPARQARDAQDQARAHRRLRGRRLPRRTSRGAGRDRLAAARPVRRRRRRCSTSASSALPDGAARAS